MKVAGIIAEYNPFHRGHAYQIDAARRRFGADYVAVAMSGDFVQRGEPAVADKYTRAAMALSAGADLVLELPACFATSSAEDFAACGVALFDRLGVTDLLCFGSESGDPAPLTRIADLLLEEPDDYAHVLQERLALGDAYPKARAAAIRQSADGVADPDVIDRLLSSPNDILGIEYLKAIKKRGSRLRPAVLKRMGQGYLDTTLPEADSLASASALRTVLQNDGTQTAARRDQLLSAQIPADAYAILHGCPAYLAADDLTPLLNARLLSLLHKGADLAQFAGLSPELAARLSHCALNFATFSDRIGQLKTRSYTYTRISRALLHLTLGITDEDIAHAKAADYAPYARILGFRRAAAPLLSALKQESSVPLITKTADASSLLDADGLRMLHQDFYVSHLYRSMVFAKSGTRMKNEYTRSVIVM